VLRVQYAIPWLPGFVIQLISPIKLPNPILHHGGMCPLENGQPSKRTIVKIWHFRFLCLVESPMKFFLDFPFKSHDFWMPHVAVMIDMHRQVNDVQFLVVHLPERNRINIGVTSNAVPHKPDLFPADMMYVYAVPVIAPKMNIRHQESIHCKVFTVSHAMRFNGSYFFLMQNFIGLQVQAPVAMALTKRKTCFVCEDFSTEEKLLIPLPLVNFNFGIADTQQYL
jgi:hypothetical protein